VNSTAKSMQNREFRHFGESKSIELTNSKMLDFRFVSIANLIQMRRIKVNSPHRLNDRHPSENRTEQVIETTVWVLGIGFALRSGTEPSRMATVAPFLPPSMRPLRDAIADRERFDRRGRSSSQPRRSKSQAVPVWGARDSNFAFGSDSVLSASGTGNPVR
jgi:hypothetical protein